jgi:cobalt-zinc-cadmium efflux system outer membrane protein
MALDPIDRKLRAAVLLVATVSVCALPEVAFAQKQLADDLIVLNSGQRAVESQRAAGDRGPGSDYNRLAIPPGEAVPGLEPVPGAAHAFTRNRDVLAAAANPIATAMARPRVEAIPTPIPRTPAALPAGGPLEIPSHEDAGPPDGLTLESVITLTIERNQSLQTRFQEIRKADADVLTAGLRGNPSVFGSVDSVPYGSYSPERPGEPGYSVTVIQPFDVNNKRGYRIIAAQRAKSVIHAQYQDAVRLEIDALYTLYTDVLAARETLRYVESSIVGLGEVRGTVDRLVRGGELSSLELDRIDLQLDAADIARAEAAVALAKAKQRLALVTMLPDPGEVPFDIRGTLHTDTNAIPPADQLVQVARQNRPDIQAFSLGVQRASAEVQLAVKERYPDVFVLYTPWGMVDNTALGAQNATSWGVSGMASVPLFNRNQGSIRRAEASRSQAEIELDQLCRRIDMEVRQVASEVDVARKRAERLETTIVPRARRIRDLTLAQVQGGQADMLAYLQSQREYVDVVRQYRDALLDLRRAALRINTAIGMRIVYDPVETRFAPAAPPQ